MDDKIKIKKEMINARNKLYEFMGNYIVKDSKEENTHNMIPYNDGLNGGGGAYNIPEEEYETFMELYIEANILMLAAKEEDRYIVEVPRKISPLCADIDFKQKIKQRQYGVDTIQKIIGVYKRVIDKYFNASDKQKNAFVLEKKCPTFKKDDIYSDGIHIVFPYLPADRRAKMLVVYEAMKIAEKEKIFDELELVNTNYSDIFDLSMFKNDIQTGWCMYGSRKPNGGLYLLSHIFNHNLARLKLKENSNLNKLPLVLSMRQYSDDISVPYDYDKFDDVDLDNILEKIYDEMGLNKKKKKKEKKIKEKEITDDFELVEDNYLTDYGIDEYPDKSLNSIELEARRLTELLSPERAGPYSSWIMVCWALANISKKLKYDFFRFSEKSSSGNFDANGCNVQWERAIEYDGDYKLGLGSLRLWAKKDNPEGYSRFITMSVSPLMKEAESGTHTDIAMVLYYMFKDQFVCASIGKNVWYQFVDHRWVQIDGGYTLMNKISDDLSGNFTNMIGKTINDKENPLNRGDSRDFDDKRMVDFMKIIKNLKNSSFKGKIMDECRRRFHIPKFGDRLDGNPDLIGFNNGIYDLERKCFRDGLPEDYVTFTTGYDWVEYSDDHEYIKDVVDFFEKLHNKEHIRNYILKLFAAHLSGRILSNRFVIWTGSGSNGKSTAIELFQYAYGEYCDTVAVTLLTRKPGNSREASPEVAGLRGKRFVVFQEPEGDDQIYPGNMKMMTGKDEIPARPLYGDPIKFRPQFKMVLTCNRLPTIKAYDDGTWRRMEVTKWGAKFLDHDRVIKKPDVEFYKDYKLDKKLKKWKGAFMWYLIKRVYEPNNMNETAIIAPEEVKISTTNYQHDTNYFCEFMDETVIKVEDDETATVSIPYLYDRFKEFYEGNYDKKIPPKRELINFFNTKEYVIKNNALVGFRKKDLNVTE
jgi:P4 family phage/plasmid primase-like protien